MLLSIIASYPERAAPTPAIPSDRGALEPAVDLRLSGDVPHERNPFAVYISGKPSEASRRGLTASLDRAARTLTGGVVARGIALDWAAVRYQHVAALRSALIDKGAAPSTVNHVISAVRGCLREAWRLGLIDDEQLARVSDVGSVKAQPLPAGRHVAAGEVAALFRAARTEDAIGARDAALLAILYGSGLRRSEAVALDLDDYDAESGALAVRSGKGRKGRIVYAANGARAAIAAWLQVRGTAPGPLLLPFRKAGSIQWRRMTGQAVMVSLGKLAKRAGVAPFTPHDLRRSFIGELLDAGADIATVQALAGHANVGTTARYDRRPEAARRKAADLLHVPYSD